MAKIPSQICSTKPKISHFLKQSIYYIQDDNIKSEAFIKQLFI